MNALMPAIRSSVPPNHSMKKELAMNTTPAIMVASLNWVWSWSWPQLPPSSS